MGTELWGTRKIINWLTARSRNQPRVVGIVQGAFLARLIENEYLAQIEALEEKHKRELEEAEGAQPNWATRRLLLSVLGAKIRDAWKRPGRPVQISGGYLIADDGYAFGIFKHYKEWIVIDCRHYLDKYEEVGTFRTLSETCHWCRQQGVENG